jgi:hypothetical protein
MAAVHNLWGVRERERSFKYPEMFCPYRYSEYTLVLLQTVRRVKGKVVPVI